MITTLTRATDPRTSLEAAILMDATGTATKHRNACLAEVRRLPGQTAAEIAKSLGMYRPEPSRRLPELRTKGLVSNDGMSRICTVQGHRSMTWWPVEAKP